MFVSVGLLVGCISGTLSKLWLSDDVALLCVHACVCVCMRACARTCVVYDKLTLLCPLSVL